MNHLIGRKVVGFEFSGYPHFIEEMKDYVGKIGTIKRVNKSCIGIRFKGIYGEETWSYPIEETLNNLILEDFMEEENKQDLEIIGKEFTTFEFKSDELLQYSISHCRLINKVAKVVEIHKDFPDYTLCEVLEIDGDNTTITRLYYPTSIVKDKTTERIVSLENVLLDFKKIISNI